jgi:hypothetical protein
VKGWRFDNVPWNGLQLIGSSLATATAPKLLVDRFLDG